MWFGQLLSQVRDMLLRPLALIGALCLNLPFFTQAHATDAPLNTAANVHASLTAMVQQAQRSAWTTPPPHATAPTTVGM